MGSSPSTQVEKLSGWETLPTSDQVAVRSLVKEVPSSAKSGMEFLLFQYAFVPDPWGRSVIISLTFVGRLGKQVKAQGDEELKQSSTKAGTKRRKDTGDDEKAKVAKAVGDVSTSRSQPVKSNNQVDEKNPEATDLNAKLEAQTKELWTMKDDLKKHVTTAELRAMLEANGQDSTGSELDLRDRW